MPGLVGYDAAFARGQHIAMSRALAERYGGGAARGEITPYKKPDENSPYMRAARLDELHRRLKEEEIALRKAESEDGETDAGVKAYSRKKDYYEVLGIDMAASPQEIRRAFRRVSLRWHPDKQHGKSAEARERAALEYAELREAMDVLGHDATRREYDRMMAAAKMAKDPKEKFTDMDAAVKKAKPPPRRAPPVYYEVELTLEEFFRGCTKRVTHHRTFADGKRREIELEVRIPAGAAAGTEYFFRGLGDHQPTDSGMQDADVVIALRDAPHPTGITRQGDDLVAIIDLDGRTDDEEGGAKGLHRGKLLVALVVQSLFFESVSLIAHTLQLQLEEGCIEAHARVRAKGMPRAKFATGHVATFTVEGTYQQSSGPPKEDHKIVTSTEELLSHAASRTLLASSPRAHTGQ